MPSLSSSSPVPRLVVLYFSFIRFFVSPYTSRRLLHLSPASPFSLINYRWVGSFAGFFPRPLPGLSCLRPPPPLRPSPALNFLCLFNYSQCSHRCCHRVAGRRGLLPVAGDAYAWCTVWRLFPQRQRLFKGRGCTVLIENIARRSLVVLVTVGWVCRAA